MGTIHLILDNDATRNTPKLKRRLARHPRFAVHFTPMSGSWPNQIERVFRRDHGAAILPRL